MRVTGFGLSCFGISSRGFIVCLCTSLLPALAGQLVRAVRILKRGSRSPLFPLGCGILHLWSTEPRSPVLLASATATTLKGRLPSKSFSHGLALSSVRTWRRTDAAPVTRSDRNSGLPILEMRPRRSLPPLEWAFGVSPIQAAKCRADLKPPGSGTSALTAIAIMAQRRESSRGDAYRRLAWPGQQSHAQVFRSARPGAQSGRPSP